MAPAREIKPYQKQLYLVWSFHSILLSIARAGASANPIFFAKYKENASEFQLVGESVGSLHTSTTGDMGPHNSLSTVLVYDIFLCSS